MPKKKAELEPIILSSLPPETLSAESKALWAVIDGEYKIDQAAATVLGAGLATLDTLNGQLARDGHVVSDRFDQRRPHPAAKLSRDLRREILDFVKVLPKKGSIQLW